MINKRTNGITLPQLSKTWQMIKATLVTGVYFQELPLSVLPVIESSMVIIATSSICWLLIMKIRIIFASSAEIQKTSNHTSKMENLHKKSLFSIRINQLNRGKPLRKHTSSKVLHFNQTISSFLKQVTKLFTSSKVTKSSINSTTVSFTAVITIKCLAKTYHG